MEKQHTFTFSNGIEVPIQRVSRRFVMRVRNAARAEYIRDNGEMPCPTYTRKLAGGEERTFQHNENTVLEPEFVDDEELQQAWSDYRSFQMRLRAYVQEKAWRADIWKGVNAEPPKDWLEEQAYWGVAFDDEQSAKFEWVFDLSTGWDEILLLCLAIQAIVHPVEEAAQDAADTFQHPVEDAGRDDARAN